jgi:hypothetical protein
VSQSLPPTSRRFAIGIGPRSRLLLRILFGVTQDNAYVDLSESALDAHFGWFRLRVPLANVDRWRIEGPWLWITAIGMRRGIRSGDISFDGNHMAGMRLDFRQPERRGILNIPRLYVTLDELEEFSAALTEMGIAGQDARRGVAQSG